MPVEPTPPAAMDALAEFNRRLLENVMKPMTRDGVAPAAPEMLQSLAAGLAQNSQRWLEIQKRYYEKQLALWSSVATTPSPEATPVKVVESEPGDRRFRGAEWQQPYFNFIAQSYLLNARWLAELVDAAELEPH